MQSQSVVINQKHEKKIIAILLAVFLGPWTWVYTFRRNSLKAAIGLAINLTTIIFVVFIYLSTTKDAEALANIPLENRPTDSMDLLGLAIIILFCSFIWFFIWVWAIVDAAFIKQESSGLKSQNKNTLYSLLLAIFLGPWSWLYSYTRDWWKFWPAIIIGYSSLYFNIVGFNKFGNFDGDLRFKIFLTISLSIWIISILLAVLRHFYFHKTPTEADITSSNMGKNKVTSIMLAIFLSIFTWLYTYRKDAWKFWVGFPPMILTIIFNLYSLPWNAVITLVISAGLWIWTLADVLMKTDEWYKTYGIK